MALLIDGYNLLHATNIFGPPGAGTELHRTRLAFLRFLASSLSARDRKATSVIFDAAGAPPGLPSVLTHEGMTVRFARRHSSADEMIEELLENWPSPRSLTVVSSDHRVQRAARQRGATFVDSDQWYADVRAARRKRDDAAEEPPAKRAGGASSEDLAYWVDQFQDAPDDEEDKSPFPPGYGDDITDD